jgi:hypothetical protein
MKFMKFLGTLEELKTHIGAQLTGTWSGHDPHHFRSINGGLLRWWPTTKSIVLQGPPSEVNRLRSVMGNKIVEAHKPSTDTGPSAATTSSGAAGNNTTQQPRRRAIYTLKLEVVRVEHPDEDAG